MFTINFSDTLLGPGVGWREEGGTWPTASTKYLEDTGVQRSQTTGGSKINFRFDATLSEGNDGNLAAQQPPRKSLHRRTPGRKLWAPLITVTVGS